jgi:periplasmic copper chaperone A
MNRAIPVVGLAATAVLVLSACGGTTAETDSAASNECPLAISDAWVKAADSGMTSAFGQVQNTSDAQVSITAAQTSAAAMTELHETTMVGGAMKMQEVSAFEVPAEGELMLEPGGDHLMLMNIPAPIAAGDDVAITLTCGDAGEVTFTAQARTFDGANEEYEPDSEMSDMGDMDMSDMDMSDMDSSNM